VYRTFYDRKVQQVRDLGCGGWRIYLDVEVRRVACRQCGVNQERLAWLADTPGYTKRFAFAVGRRCRTATIADVAQEFHLDWKTVKALEMQYMREQLRRVGTPAPQVIGIDEVSIRKGHTYRIVVSDLERHRPIWFGGVDRSEASLAAFYAWLGPAKSRRIRLAVMDMWRAFRKATRAHAPQAAILFDKFHVLRHLGEALDKVRKSEYARLTGQDRRFIKGQKYTLLSHRANLTLDGRRTLQTLLKANKHLAAPPVLGIGPVPQEPEVRLGSLARRGIRDPHGHRPPAEAAVQLGEPVERAVGDGDVLPQAAVDLRESQAVVEPGLDRRLMRLQQFGALAPPAGARRPQRREHAHHLLLGRWRAARAHPERRRGLQVLRHGLPIHAGAAGDGPQALAQRVPAQHFPHLDHGQLPIGHGPSWWENGGHHSPKPAPGGGMILKNYWGNDSEKLAGSVGECF